MSRKGGFVFVILPEGEELFTDSMFDVVLAKLAQPAVAEVSPMDILGKCFIASKLMFQDGSSVPIPSGARAYITGLPDGFINGETAARAWDNYNRATLRD